MKYIPKNLAVSFDLLPMALPKPREQNNFTFLCFLTEEILTDAFCDRPEAGQCAVSVEAERMFLHFGSWY